MKTNEVYKITLFEFLDFLLDSGQLDLQPIGTQVVQETAELP